MTVISDLDSASDPTGASDATGASDSNTASDPASASDPDIAADPIGTLERAGVSHAAAMASIHRMAFPPDEIWGTDAFALQLALPGVFGWLDPHGGMILARVTADQAEVLTFAVIAKARRQGIGARLLDATLRLAEAQGARTAFLEVSISNTTALALYARAGFVPVGIRPRYYADGTDAMVLRRALSHPAATAAG
jgi:ribosomal-protein-alanine N-acetyltransferase